MGIRRTWTNSHIRMNGQRCRSGILLVVLTLLATTAVSSLGQSIDMSGTVSYSRYGSQVTLKAGRVENYRSLGSTSGTLVLQLWASSTPYSGYSLTGYKLAQTSLGTLRGGYYFSNISRTASFSEPPRGSYYVTMILGEWNGYGYDTVDYHTFSGRTTFGSVTTPPPPPPPSDWALMYGVMFRDPGDVQLFRNYRDSVLKEDPVGTGATKYLYEQSEAALKVLVENDDLADMASLVANNNRDAIAASLSDETGVVTNTIEILVFLYEVEQQAPKDLAQLARSSRYLITWKLLTGQEFLGVRFEQWPWIRSREEQ